MKPMNRFTPLFLALSLGVAAGCGGGDASPADTGTSSAVPTTIWMADAPADAIDVFAARESHGDGDEIVVKGRLQDFGRLATFKLVDASLEPCTDKCATPWDYC
jgi:hypothetical protein